MTLIPADSIRLGDRARIVPQKPDIPRAKGQGPIPEGGIDVVLNDYHHELARRGAVHVFSLDVPALLPVAEEDQP